MFLSDSDEGANVGEENGCIRGDMMNRCQACGCYCSVKVGATGYMSYTEQGIYRDGGGIWKRDSGWGLGLPRNVLWLVASGGDRVWGQKSAREASGRPLFFFWRCFHTPVWRVECEDGQTFGKDGEKGWKDCGVWWLPTVMVGDS